VVIAGMIAHKAAVKRGGPAFPVSLKMKSLPGFPVRSIPTVQLTGSKSAGSMLLTVSLFGRNSYVRTSNSGCMEIKLEKDVEKKLVSSIKRYVNENLEFSFFFVITITFKVTLRSANSCAL